MRALNLELVMTEGMGVLPEVSGLAGQLEVAGFSSVRSKRLMPLTSSYAFGGRGDDSTSAVAVGEGRAGWEDHDIVRACGNRPPWPLSTSGKEPLMFQSPD